MDLKARYQTQLAQPGFRADPVQALAVEKLSALSELLSHPPLTPGLISRLLRDRGDAMPIRGLYMWGDVGRGKTWLMDMFFDCLPLREKMRTHFHRFMYLIHEQLRSLENEADPLLIVARRLSKRTRVICFDEFFVSDITDAMLLGTLLEALFQRGVTLVATSNAAPDDLYRDGLQRARFLPAIEQIKKHTQVFHLASDTDYRLRLLEQAEIYHSPLDTVSRQNMTRYFESLAGEHATAGEALVIANRPINTVRCADGVVWFDFLDICDGPRSQVDYIEIAREHHTVLVSAVPQFTPLIEDQARRFIALVDEFYDRNVKLILSSAVPAQDLYQGKRLAFEFQRTLSRLIEMQSHAYLARPHLP